MLRYPVINIPRSSYLGAPARYMPSTTSCDNAADYQKAVDNAAQRIAIYEKAMQRATAANDQAGIDNASAGSDLANRDWNAWTQKVKECASQAKPVAPVSTVGWVPIVAGLGILGVAGLLATGMIKT